MLSEDVTPQQIEEALATLNERGINVIETEEAEAVEEEETRKKRGSEETQSSELVEVTPKSLRLRKRVLAANMRPKREA